MHFQDIRHQRAKPLNYDQRIEALSSLQVAIKRKYSDITSALKSDLNKSETESYLTEISLVQQEIQYFKKNLKRLMKIKSVATPVVLKPSSAKVERRPYGDVLVISPWNYPVYLSLVPIVGAIAGGNRAFLKPSELSINVSRVLCDLLNSTLGQLKLGGAVDGGVETSMSLLEEKWDFIFFTGSTRVGQIVMERASKHLTPVVLELGGKSPCVLDKGINIAVAAKRIWWGKTVNTGQTCVAPDYVLVPKEMKDKFVEESKNALKELFPQGPRDAEHYGRIVSDEHHGRLMGLLAGAQTIIGGKGDLRDRFIEPTLLEVTDLNASVMREEIFGPILPLITYESIEDIHKTISLHPDPLALYVFSDNKSFVDLIHRNHRFGGGCVNDVLVHLAPKELPFGGVGSSGFGSYHGSSSFETFTRPVSVVRGTTGIDPSFRYPPYSERVTKVLKKFF